MTLREAKKLLKEKSMEYLLRRDDSINQQCFEKPRKKGRTILTLDDIAAKNGALKTQNGWIRYWNRKKRVSEGRWFSSMADIYQVFKQIVEAPEKHESLLASVRRNFCKVSLLSSTRIKYNPNDENAQIIHNYGSKMQKEPIELEIPVLYPGKRIATELNGKGIAFLQALLYTDDSKKEIVGVLSRIGDVPHEKLILCTPPLDNGGDSMRSKLSKRGVSLSYFAGDFHVFADGNPGRILGRSRAVILPAENNNLSECIGGKPR